MCTKYEANTTKRVAQKLNASKNEEMLLSNAATDNVQHVLNKNIPLLLTTKQSCNICKVMHHTSLDYCKKDIIPHISRSSKYLLS